ncbi:MAG: HlyC/CorC family transporter [Chloroflexi bacterium]|nr:MAG: HlyC/CorC family transporter [Chloroflexota bacterium]
MEKPSRLLATTQIGMALTAALATAIAALTLTSPLQRFLTDSGVPVTIAQPLAVGLIVFILAFALLVLGQLVPEAVAARYANEIAFFFARPLSFLAFLFFPFIGPTIWISDRLSLLMGGEPIGGMAFITEEEIMTLVDAGEEEGTIEEDEAEMIHSVFALSDTIAREIMVPRIDIVALDVHTPLDEAVNTIIEAGHSRIPVYEGTIDNIVGILYAKDLLPLWRDNRRDLPLGQLLREAYFIPESKKVDELLEEMQQQRTHMAIVVDEYGGTAGLVTVEDIVEEIVGEIQDEYDTEEPLYERVGEGEYIFNARIALDDVGHLLGIEMPTEMGDTLGGFVYGQLGKVPAQGEGFNFGPLRFEVVSVAGRRIRKVRVHRRTGPLTSEGQNDDHKR